MPNQAKPTLLYVLEKMLHDWQSSIGKSIAELESMYTDEGFCNYLHRHFAGGIEEAVYNELRKDKTQFPVDIAHWYPVAAYTDSRATIDSRCIQPRIDHIKRTILRLEHTK